MAGVFQLKLHIGHSKHQGMNPRPPPFKNSKRPSPLFRQVSSPLKSAKCSLFITFFGIKCFRLVYFSCKNCKPL